MCIFWVQIVFGVATIAAFDASVDQNILKAWKGLGWKSTILIHDQTKKKISTNAIMKAASLTGISLAFLGSEHADQNSVQRADGIVVLDSPEIVKNLIALEIIEPYQVMLVSDRANILDKFECSGMRASFFILQPSRFSLVMTFKHTCQVVENIWSTKDVSTGFYQEEYDLHGANIRSLSLDWAPWFTIGKCQDGENRDCETSGVLREMMDTLASMHNFTWTQDREPSGSWGTVPVNGSRFYSAQEERPEIFL